MRLTDYLEPELILVDLHAAGPEEAINVMVDCLHKAGKIDDPESVRHAVVEREATHTTALGNGVAIPHATLAELDRAWVFVAVAPDGVPFGGGDAEGRPERLFFMLLSPEDEAGTHIKLLARIVRLVRRSTFVDALIGAESVEALLKEIEREDALHV